MSGCANSQSEGKASAILDATEGPAKAHAAALAGDDVALMRSTGLKVVTVVSCWWRECGK